MLAAFVWDASQDRSIVVRAFSAPPALAARGLTGDVLAARFMDRLRHVQRVAATNSFVDARQLRDDADGLRVEIPQTGLSLDELHRWLVDRLGRRTNIEGALSLSEDGSLTLEVRVGAEPAVQVSGEPGELDRLIKAAAEGAFARTEPALLSRYLAGVGREDESLAAARAYALSLPTSDPSAVGAFALWALSEGDWEKSLELFHKAIRLNPRVIVPQRNLVLRYMLLGREQQAHDLAVAALRLKLKDQPANYRKGAVDRVRSGVRGAAALLEGDYATAYQAHSIGDRGALGYVPPSEVLALAHDGFGAEAAVRDSEIDNTIRPPDAAMVRLKIAQAAGDWPAMVERATALARARQAWLAEPAYPEGPPRSASSKYSVRAVYLDSRLDRPLQAVALARAGRAGEAQALLGAPPVDCAPCLRAAGVVAAEAGDWRTAETWFARAAAAAPRLPQAELAWGEALLRRGDALGAIGKLSSAATKAPRFADPLELWGEALLLQGDASGAAVKFAQAAKLAPRWGRLHLKWGEALAKLGKADEARAKWRAAATMDLSLADRADLLEVSRKQTR